MDCVSCHEPHGQGYWDTDRRPLASPFDDGQCTSCHPSKMADIQAHTGPLPPDGMDILPALLANATSPRRELVHNIDERSAHSLHQVRETPSRPRRWANFSVL